METTEVAGALAVLTSESAKELVHRVGEIFSNLLGPVTEELGLTLGDYGAYYRLKNMVALGEKTQRLLRGRRITETLNLGRILPILQIASMESDEDLHSRWAALLANVLLEATSVHPSFTEVLKQVTSDDARWLDRVCEELKGNYEELAVPYRQRFGKEPYNFTYSRREVNFQMLVGANKLTLDNVQRLGLVQHIRPSPTDEEPYPESYFRITDFGSAFVLACRVE